MKRVSVVLLGFILAAELAAAHDLFLRPLRFFVSPNSAVEVRVLNGTFTTSENAVARDRLRDLSVVTPQGRVALEPGGWSEGGDTSILRFRVGEAGTYVVGASTHPRTIKLTAEQFNEYLASDGVDDVLAERRRTKQLDQPAHERYSKHVKTVLQAGAARTTGFDSVFGYPAELVPLDNPYALRVGSRLRLRALVDGVPAKNQLVLTGGRTTQGARLRVQRLRSNASGLVTVPVTQRGYWYVKFIHMVPVANDSVNYESKWATLTFQVR